MAPGLGLLDDTIELLLDQYEFPAAQYAIAQGGSVIAEGAFGQATESSRFSIMSATKPVFAALVLQLISEGKLTLHTRIAELWPEFSAHGKGEMTVEQLLTFTAGIPEWWPDERATLDRATRIEEAVALEPAWTPGTATAYHSVSAHWILAEVVTRVTGQDHRKVLRSAVLDPLGLDRLELGVPIDNTERPIPFVKIGPLRPDLVRAVTGVEMTEAELEAAEDRALLHANDPETIAAGVPGAGAISDAASLALFHQHLLHDPLGLWDPRLRRAAISEPTNTFPEDSRGGAAANRSIGCLLITRDEPVRITVPNLGVDVTARHHGAVVSDGTFGQGGAGGQIAITDPTRGISFVYLSNGFLRDGLADMRRVQKIIDTAMRAVDDA